MDNDTRSDQDDCPVRKSSRLAPYDRESTMLSYHLSMLTNGVDRLRTENRAILEENKLLREENASLRAGMTNQDKIDFFNQNEEWVRMFVACNPRDGDDY